VLVTTLIVQAPLLLHAVEHGIVKALEISWNYLLSPTMLASYVYLYIIIRASHAGGRTVKLSSRDTMVSNWFLMNGVYYNLFLDVVSGQFQMNNLMTFQYNLVEPRYKFGAEDVRGQSVFWTSMCEIFFQSPFCILTYYAYIRGKPWRRPLEIVVGCLHIAGVWWFYVPEAYAGFPHLGGWPKPGEHLTFHRLFYFYLGFWVMGATWVIVAFTIARTAFLEISAIIEQHDREIKSS